VRRVKVERRPPAVEKVREAAWKKPGREAPADEQYLEARNSAI
jgi:hypothetical protein